MTVICHVLSQHDIFPKYNASKNGNNAIAPKSSCGIDLFHSPGENSFQMMQNSVSDKRNKMLALSVHAIELAVKQNCQCTI